MQGYAVLQRVVLVLAALILLVAGLRPGEGRPAASPGCSAPHPGARR